VFGKIYHKKDRGIRNFWRKKTILKRGGGGGRIFMKIFTPVYFNNNTLIPIFNTLGEKNIGLQVNYLNIFPKFVYLP